MNIVATAKFKGGDWKKFEQQLVTRLMGAARQAAQIVLDESQARVPHGATGDLAASGHRSSQWIENDIVRSYVTYSAMYAAFVEFGTGLRGRGTYRYPLPQQGVPITGFWHYDYKAQGWIGMPSHPYLRPALDNGRAGALDAFRQVLGR